MSNALVSPFARPPEQETFIEVAPGVRWLRLPLPFKLNHINLYLLADDDGWTLIDTGINRELSRSLWEQHFEKTLEGKPLKRVIVTHFHPDHVGCASWLVDRWQAEFMTSRTEWLFARMLRLESGADVAAFWGDYYRSAGLSEEVLLGIATRGERYAEHVATIPRPFRRLAEGDTVVIGGRTWRVVIGHGHSPELICLYAEADGLFISSDQVLPGISPNVSTSAPEPYSDPLTEFLETCAALRAIDPGVLVLPMHGLPFYGLHDRLAQLETHHAERLELTRDACREPRTIAELMPLMFKRELDLQQMQFAVGEAFAHTNRLVTKGGLARIAEPGQPLRFESL